MYSIVMLTAMSAGADVTPPPMVAPAAVVAPVASGCCGSVSMGCYGSSCYGSSCYGSSCHGSCHGGFLGMRSGGLFSHRSSCHGCCGGYSCHGSSCYGSRYSCHGSGYGYGYAGGSCSGYSCFGSAYSSFNSCYGSASYLSGSSWGPPIGMPPYTLHGYNSGLSPVWGPGAPVVIGSLTDPNAVYGAATNPNRPPVMTVPVAPMVKPNSDGLPMGANLKFNLPADAKLFVDGKPAPGTGTVRTFYTPPLAAGQKFFYDVKAELMIDGKPVVEEKRVIVEAGSDLTETFSKLVAALGSTGTVAGK